MLGNVPLHTRTDAGTTTTHHRRPYALWRECIVLATYSLLCCLMGALLGWRIAAWEHRHCVHAPFSLEKIIPLSLERDGRNTL